MKDCKSPEYLARYKEGPVGILTILPGGTPGMAKNLVQWFLYCLVISCFTAYVCTLLPAGTVYGVVFRWAGTVAILGYAVGGLVDSIWKGQKWSITFKFMFDGLVYGLVTAGTFGWLFLSYTESEHGHAFESKAQRARPGWTGPAHYRYAGGHLHGGAILLHHSPHSNFELGGYNIHHLFTGLPDRSRRRSACTFAGPVALARCLRHRVRHGIGPESG